MDNYQFHIGHLIKQHVESHGIGVGWLSKQLHCHSNTIYNIFERNWIDTQTLMKLSQVLNHDFFADFPANYQKRSGEGE